MSFSLRKAAPNLALALISVGGAFAASNQAFAGDNRATTQQETSSIPAGDHDLIDERAQIIQTETGYKILAVPKSLDLSPGSMRGYVALTSKKNQGMIVVFLDHAKQETLDTCLAEMDRVYKSGRHNIALILGEEGSERDYLSLWQNGVPIPVGSKEVRLNHLDPNVDKSLRLDITRLAARVCVHHDALHGKPEERVAQANVASNDL